MKWRARSSQMERVRSNYGLGCWAATVFGVDWCSRGSLPFAFGRPLRADWLERKRPTLNLQRLEQPSRVPGLPVPMAQLDG